MCSALDFPAGKAVSYRKLDESLLMRALLLLFKFIAQPLDHSQLGDREVPADHMRVFLSQFLFFYLFRWSVKRDDIRSFAGRPSFPPGGGPKGGSWLDQYKQWGSYYRTALGNAAGPVLDSRGAFPNIQTLNHDYRPP